jgi:signal transduction histidine kinase
MRVVFFFTEGLLISILSAARRDAEKQKDEFIALLSHELKNPLTVIKSYSGLLKNHAISSENERQVQYISKVEVHTNKIVELINDLLDVSKITSGKLIFSDEYFSLFQLVVDTVRDQRLVSKTHAILLKGTSKKVIWGDRYRIGQIITNLITNAIKYSPTKDKVVVIIKDNKHGTRIEIKDYGMGIGEHDQDLIFDRFYRGRAEKTKIQGLGMGLYISSQIAKRHKGKLWLKSKPGKGSSFFLQLPTLSDRHKILKQQLRKSS